MAAIRGGAQYSPAGIVGPKRVNGFSRTDTALLGLTRYSKTHLPPLHFTDLATSPMVPS